MATATEVARGRAFPRLDWGAMFAGVLLAIAVHVVMGLVGVALGFAARPSDSRAIGAAAAIWALVTPFVATGVGAWLACRMARAEDARAGALHGVLVWCVGLIAGALFLAGTMATGAMTAGTAASGNIAAAQRAAGETIRGRAPQARAGADEAAKAAATGAGAGALAAIAGLLGGIVGAALASGRRGGMARGWRSPFRRDEGARAGTIPAGSATTYGTEGSTHLGGPGSPGVPPTDPYGHH
jgi:hypothetical protein